MLNIPKHDALAKALFNPIVYRGPTFYKYMFKTGQWPDRCGPFATHAYCGFTYHMRMLKMCPKSPAESWAEPKVGGFNPNAYRGRTYINHMGKIRASGTL